MSTPEILLWDQAYNRNGDAKLPRTVVNAVRTYMDNDDLTGWVSQETLARDTGLDETNVRRQIKKNVDAGWLVVTKRGRAGRASEYRLAYPQPGADARLDANEGEVPTGRICPVTESDPNRANMPGYTSQPGADARLLPGADARPTSPGTSPQEKFLREAVGKTTNNGPDSDPWGGSPSQPATEENRPPGLQPPTAGGCQVDDPFASEPVWRAEVAAREERAAGDPQPATAGGPTATKYADPWA